MVRAKIVWDKYDANSFFKKKKFEQRAIAAGGDITRTPLSSKKFPLHGPARTIRVSALDNQALALEHRAKGVVGGNPLAWAAAAAFLGRSLAVAKRKADKEALAHRVVAIRHRLERLLLLVYLLVLGHVGLVAKVVKVARIRLRVELGHKRRARLTQRGPVHFGKVLVVVNIFNICKASHARVDAPREWGSTVLVRHDFLLVLDILFKQGY